MAGSNLSDETIRNTLQAKLLPYGSISYLEMATAAYQKGRRRLATMILDIVQNAVDQVLYHCAYVRVFGFVYISVCLCTWVCVHACVCICYACTCMCIRVCTYVFVHLTIELHYFPLQLFFTFHDITKYSNKLNINYNRKFDVFF